MTCGGPPKFSWNFVCAGSPGTWPAVSTWRAPMTTPENALPLTSTLPTPAQGDVAVFGSTRAAGESGGAPAMIAPAGCNQTSVSAKTTIRRNLRHAQPVRDGQHPIERAHHRQLDQLAVHHHEAARIRFERRAHLARLFDGLGVGRE